ncbi:MAG: hypothetical protein KF852_19800 [Saprospiraceae bacterium]|nr:hypothetical protein [Saprospiraceae bacterium]
MFQHTIEPFGVFQKHIISSSSGSERITFVPGHGACLLDLVLDGVSVLDGYSTPEELIENRYGKNIVLYPFPNRLKEGRYSWQGRPYQFPVNDTKTGNAIHGLGRTRPTQVSRVDLDETGASVTCLRHETGEDEGYPFIFTFSITFTIRTGGVFEMDLRFKNHSDMPIPVGMGWHPYFRLADSADEMSLHLPACRRVEIDATMIPTGKILPEERFAAARSIGDEVIDNCFQLDEAAPLAEVQLSGPAGRLHYAQQTGAGKFNYLQIFTPPHRRSVALEPMTCNIDAFNNGMGLIALEPGEEAHAAIQVRFKQPV